METRKTFLIGALLLASSVLATADETRALVLDPKGHKLVAVDLRTGEVAKSAALTGTPSYMVRSADGARLAILDGGPQKLTFCCGLQPKGPVTATLVDARTLEVGAKVEVGWGMASWPTPAFAALALRVATLPSPDGRRVSVLCAGYSSKKPEEFHARELVTLDLETGRIEGRVSLERDVAAMWGSPDGTTAILFVRTEGGDGALPAEVLFLDLTSHSVTHRVSLEGAPSESLRSPAGDWLYLLDVGKPSTKRAKNVNGALSIVSMAERRVVARLDAGSNPRALVWDESRGNVIVPSDTLPEAGGDDPGGELRVFRGSEALKTVTLPEEPHLVRLEGARAYVAGRRTLMRVDLDSYGRLADIPLDDASRVTNLVFSKEDRAFATYEGSSRLSVIDLETPRLVGSVSTGRGGIKFAKALGAMALSAAATASSYYQGQTVARTQGHSSFTYNVYRFGVAAPESDLIVGPDGRFVYALNTQTSDVTIVDSATASIVSKESAKGRSLARLDDGTRFTVLGKDELRVFDTQTQRVGEPLRFEGSDEVRLLFSEDRGTALAWGGKTLYLLEPRSGSLRAAVPGLESVGPVMFDDGGLSQQVTESPGRESR